MIKNEGMWGYLNNPWDINGNIYNSNWKWPLRNQINMKPDSMKNKFFLRSKCTKSTVKNMKVHWK